MRNKIFAVMSVAAVVASLAFAVYCANEIRQRNHKPKNAAVALQFPCPTGQMLGADNKCFPVTASGGIVTTSATIDPKFTNTLDLSGSGQPKKIAGILCNGKEYTEDDADTAVMLVVEEYAGRLPWRPSIGDAENALKRLAKLEQWATMTPMDSRLLRLYRKWIDHRRREANKVISNTGEDEGSKAIAMLQRGEEVKKCIPKPGAGK